MGIKNKTILFFAAAVVSAAFVASMLVPGTQKLSHAEVEAFREEVSELAIKKGPDVAVKRANAIMEQYRLGYDFCHSMASDMGKLAIDTDRDFVKAVSHSDEVLGFCTGGYLHGAAEKALRLSNTMQKDAAALCGALPAINKPYFYQTCVHGVGHGLMAATHNNLPEALKLCERSFAGSERYQKACIEGVYMENFDAGHGHDDSPASPHMNDADMAYPCPIQPEAYKELCYVHSAEHFYHNNPGKYVEALDFCGTIEAAYQGACVKSAAKRMMQNNMHQPEFAEQYCRSTSPNYFGDCIYGVASGYGEFNPGEEKGREFCGRILLEDNKKYCPALWK